MLARRTGTRFLVGCCLVAGALAVVSGLQAGDTDGGATKAEPAVQRAIERVYPALVQIHVLSLAHDSGHERKQAASGSGAIISAEGYVVTNHHVAGKATAIRV